jgi:hypothetical protein
METKAEVPVRNAYGSEPSSRCFLEAALTTPGDRLANATNLQAKDTFGVKVL